MKPDLWLTVETHKAFWCVRFPSRGRQRIVRTTMIVRITIAWISIGQPRRFVEERRDRGLIEPRSRRDRASFVVESPPRSSYGDRWSINTTIDARSWPDRGAILVLLEAKLKPNSPSNWSGIEATTLPQGTAPTMPVISPHDRLYRP